MNKLSIAVKQLKAADEEIYRLEDINKALYLACSLGLRFLESEPRGNFRRDNEIGYEYLDEAIHYLKIGIAKNDAEAKQ